MDTIARLYASKFIARPGVKAEQQGNGAYYPVDEKFTMQDLRDHLNGTRTYGHYLIDPDSDQCKFFAFDIDFEVSGTLPQSDPDGIGSDVASAVNPRVCWRDRSHPARNFMKSQLMHVAGLLASKAHRELDLPVAIAYSGYKGVHVYCFTGPIVTSKAREGAQLVMELAGGVLHKGNNFYHLPGDETFLENLSIEIFPKQETIGDKKYGNLMRLPLGVNRKAPSDPTFFIDLTQPPAAMAPVKTESVVQYLENGDPWS